MDWPPLASSARRNPRGRRIGVNQRASPAARRLVDLPDHPGVVILIRAVPGPGSAGRVARSARSRRRRVALSIIGRDRAHFALALAPLFARLLGAVMLRAPRTRLRPSVGPALEHGGEGQAILGRDIAPRGGGDHLGLGGGEARGIGDRRQVEPDQRDARPPSAMRSTVAMACTLPTLALLSATLCTSAMSLPPMMPGMIASTVVGSSVWAVCSSGALHAIGLVLW